MVGLSSRRVNSKMGNITKILVVAKAPDGGVATFINTLIEIKSYKWHVISIEKPRLSKINTGNFSYLRDFKYRNSYSFPSANLFQTLIDLIVLYSRIKNIRPKTIIAVDLYPSLIIAFLKKMSLIHTPLILVNQASLKDMVQSKSSLIFKKLVFFMVRVFYKSADYTVSTSKHVSEDMINFFKLPQKKVTTIYNGISVPKKELQRKVEVKKTVLMVAKFIEPKDHKTLLKAFAIVLRSFPDYKLQLLGDGPKRPQIELLAKRLGISSDIDFLGWKDNVYPYIARCKLFVLSTENEGFGYALVEAMAFGKPVIASDAPWGPREILDNGKFGYVFKIGSKLDLSKKIINLLKNDSLQKHYSQLSLKRALDFKIQRFIEKYNKLLEKFS